MQRGDGRSCSCRREMRQTRRMDENLAMEIPHSTLPTVAHDIPHSALNVSGVQIMPYRLLKDSVVVQLVVGLYI